MPVFNHDELRRYLRQHLQEAGVAKAVAGEVADNLVESSLQGHDSHGVTLIPRYIEAIRAGELDPQATPQLLRDAGPVISFHGGNGFGQLTGRLAMEQAILRVRQFGVCIMGLAQTHHLGRIGAWAEQAAAEGLVSLHFANVGARSVVLPFNGQRPRFGTNPFCVGIPVAGKPPVVLDFATSTIAGNKARIAWNAGRELPPGCAVDNVGNPTRDPRWLMQEPLGALLAFGAHKGSGLALICSLLGAALTGGETESAPPPPGPASSTICCRSSSTRPCSARGSATPRRWPTCWHGPAHRETTTGCCCPVRQSSGSGNFACSTVSKSMRSAGSSSKRWKAPCLRRILEITTSVIRRAR